MKEILRAEKITKAYGDNKVLGDVSITLHEGEIISLLGVSGVGKSTLFNVLSGLIIPDRGSVLLRDSVNETTPKDGVKHTDHDVNKDEVGKDWINITGQNGHLSYMLQKDLLLPHKTVVDNVALPLTLSGVKKKEAREMAANHFQQFGLQGTEYMYPSQLSGGMRQRAALLRTYLCGKKVALLDEPFGALDTLTRSSIHEWYLKLMEDIKLSTILITHDIDEAILLSDRIYIMKGSPANINQEIVIEEPKPRNNDFVLTEEFLNYKKMIREML